MRKQTVWNIGRYLLIVAAGLVLAAPLLYMVSGSLKSVAEIYRFPPPLVPRTPVWGNFSSAWELLTPRVIANSFAFSVGVVGLQLLISLPAAFALAKIPFRWTAGIVGLLIVPNFVPGNLTLIPLFVVTFKLGWLNSFAGMIVPMAAQCAFAVLLFRQFFVTLPSGLVDAARVDGASWWRVLVSVGLPLAKPALATYCSISFLTAWNMYIWPKIVAPDPTHMVLNVALAPLAAAQNGAVSPAVAQAGGVIAMIPVLIVFVGFQKWYVKGVVGTGLE